MKKFYIFITIILMIIFTYFIMVTNSKNYKVDYEVDNFKIEEKYNKKTKLYSFTIKNKDEKFLFVADNNYSNKRKLIKSIDYIDNDTYYCLKPVIKGFKFNYICYDGEYKDEYVSGLKTQEKQKKLKTVNNIDVFNKKFNYYVWNGYGITDILSNKKYNFLDREQYDNQLSITTDSYILFVDYEQTHTFDRFYIFDVNKKKMIEWNIKFDIDFDSYFMGVIDDYIYLFDRKNVIQYKINIEKKKIEVTSDNNGALYFDKEWSNKPIKELKYKDYYMADDYLYDYFIKDKKLYLNINNSLDILISKKEIKDIIYKDNDKVFYLVDDTIYCYQYGNGELILLKDFEWNFSYKNKIFIF